MAILRRLLGPAVLAGGLLLLTAPGGLAGGWAVTTLDPSDASPVAGATVAVGFTIRQHGVTPVAVDDVAVVVRTDGAGDGEGEEFAARPSGIVGHYVADVRFPAAGTYSWEVRQGWFGPQSLGTVTVERASAAATAGRRWPLSVRVALPILAVLLGAAALRTQRPARRTRSVTA